MATVISCIGALAESAAHHHGAGTVLALIESLDKAHSILMEAAPHGVFVKMVYTTVFGQGSESMCPPL